MSRSQSDADRIAVAATMTAVAAIVWIVVAVVPNPLDVSIESVHAATARHVDEGNRAGSHAAAAQAIAMF